MKRTGLEILPAFTVLVMSLILSMTVFAQGQQPGRQELKKEAGKERPQRPSASDLAKRKTDHMKNQLSLDQKQYVEIYKLNLQQFKEMEERPQMGERPQIREGSQKNSIKNEKKLKEILTPEQFLKWRRMEEEKLNKMPMEAAPVSVVK